jgi:hypothetical protein
VALKMLDSNGEGPSDNILKAALWLLQTSLDGVEANENNSTNADVLGVDVVNMSLGYPGSPYDPLGTQICRAMAALNDHGVALVAAAGNDGGPANNAMPAACAGVVSVTAIDQGDGSAGVAQAPAWFSNYLLLQGAGVLPPTDNKANLTVSAPGVRLLRVCVQGGGDGVRCLALPLAAWRGPFAVCLLSSKPNRGHPNMPPPNKHPHHRRGHLQHVLPAGRTLLLAVRHQPGHAARRRHAGPLLLQQPLQEPQRGRHVHAVCC